MTRQQQPPDRSDGANMYEQIYTAIRRIPPGRVSTYGTIGQLVGTQARVVGYALHYLRFVDRRDVPWQRVVNARGGISTYGDEQQRLLEQEGVEFNPRGLIDLDRWGWWDDD